MKYLTLLLLTIALFGSNTSVNDAILGIWWTPEKDGKLEMYEKDGLIFGKLIWAETPGKDTKNPDPEMRSRDLVGTDIIKNFTYNTRKERWEGGTIYDANSGKTYSCRMWFPDGDTKKLKVRGYIGISLLGRTEVFERVE